MTARKKALICGVGGQDGAYLAKLLLEKDYDVVGTSRDAMATGFRSLERLGIRDRVKTISMATNDFRSVLNALEISQADEVYNLAGQTSVGLSFEQPVETMDSIMGGVLSLLEAIRFTRRRIKFYNAGSSECFGEAGEVPADEETVFQPRSPYAVAKASSHWLVRNYRESYGLFACTGILFNHESPLRPERFVTQKIVRAAASIAAGRSGRLNLGNISIQRDWGWAPDYVEAMWRMLQLETPEDLVIATGRTVSLEYFVERAFRCFDLDWKEFVHSDPSLLRPSEIMVGRADPTKAFKLLGWRSSMDVDGVIAQMCRAVKDGNG
jgi:GDPmannose 4,6-dehydratase